MWGLVLGLACVGATAGQGPVPPGRAAGSAPDLCDVVVVVDGAARLASTEAGRGSLRVLGEMGLFSDTSIAWAELASALGMSPMGALEAVAGSRTMLMATRETGQTPAGWALLTEVSGETEQLIRSRLKPVPRRIVDGQPVLMLENGRFLLATRRAKRVGSALVLVAPADSPSLFEACLPLLAGKHAASPIERDASAARVLGDAGCDAFLLYRGRVSDEPDAARTLATVGATANEGDAGGLPGWRAVIACEPAFLGGDDLIARSRIPDALFRAISEGAVVAIGAPISDARDGGSAFSRMLYRFTSDMAPLFEGAGVVSIRARDARAESGSEILIAASMKRREDIAKAIDGGMASLVNRLTRAEAPDADAQDFGGRFPSAVREAALTERSLSFLTPLIGGRPIARWCSAGLERNETPGWWLLSLSDAGVPSGAGALRAVASALSPDEEAAEDGAWTTAGVVRPDRMIEMAPPVLSTLVRPLMPLRWVSLLEWRAMRGPDGLVRGESRVEFVRGAVGE